LLLLHAGFEMGVTVDGQSV